MGAGAEAKLSRFAGGVLVYNLAVIAWGAYVRASGSGAGCGAHWPMCNGEIVPRAPRVETLVELSHRVTSGVALLLVLILAVRVTRATPRGAPARRAAWWSMGFVSAEALIGAGLVLFELVAHDQSAKRALSMALHLTNTFFLLGALGLTFLFLREGATRGLLLRQQGSRAWALCVAAGALLLAGASGAVAALGDTLFRARSLAEGLAQDLSPTAHLFVRLRGLHPMFALVAAAAVLVAAAVCRSSSRGGADGARVERAATLLGALGILQIVVGVTNLGLLAPIPLQLVHLLMADLVWLALLRLAFLALRGRAGGSAAHHLEERAGAEQRGAAVH